ncbi:hypothetical protein HDU96_004903 [Phlyctochytrium bullatum]|nr:hypothetical protein HDU96_004903 [Phlyctochytrium bullatum]
MPKRPGEPTPTELAELGLLGLPGMKGFIALVVTGVVLYALRLGPVATTVVAIFSLPGVFSKPFEIEQVAGPLVLAVAYKIATYFRITIGFYVALTVGIIIGYFNEKSDLESTKNATTVESGESVIGLAGPESPTVNSTEDVATCAGGDSAAVTLNSDDVLAADGNVPATTNSNDGAKLYATPTSMSPILKDDATAEGALEVTFVPPNSVPVGCTAPAAEGASADVPLPDGFTFLPPLVDPEAPMAASAASPAAIIEPLHVALAAFVEPTAPFDVLAALFDPSSVFLQLFDRALDLARLTDEDLAVLQEEVIEARVKAADAINEAEEIWQKANAEKNKADAAFAEFDAVRKEAKMATEANTCAVIPMFADGAALQRQDAAKRGEIAATKKDFAANLFETAAMKKLAAAALSDAVAAKIEVAAIGEFSVYMNTDLVDRTAASNIMILRREAEFLRTEASSLRHEKSVARYEAAEARKKAADAREDVAALRRDLDAVGSSENIPKPTGDAETDRVEAPLAL